VLGSGIISIWLGNRAVLERGAVSRASMAARHNSGTERDRKWRCIALDAARSKVFGNFG
jgi:hypothetical protein